MKVHVRFTRLLAVILVAACSRFSAPAETAIPKIAVEKTQLSNGLDVLMVEDHRLTRVSVSIWYHVGPVNEEPGRTGFAHLFEHMMFQKSKHVAEDAFFRTLEAAGGSDMNGTTDQDRTTYFETVPTNQLETVLWLESDRMGYLLDDLTAESFKNQQDVVRNERRQSIENEPYGIVSEAVTHALFPKEHPYYADVIGSHQDIQAAQVADVRKFFKQYYSPNNATLVVVGVRFQRPRLDRELLRESGRRASRHPSGTTMRISPRQMSARYRASFTTAAVELANRSLGIHSCRRPPDPLRDRLTRLRAGRGGDRERADEEHRLLHERVVRDALGDVVEAEHRGDDGDAEQAGVGLQPDDRQDARGRRLQVQHLAPDQPSHQRRDQERQPGERDAHADVGIDLQSRDVEERDQRHDDVQQELEDPACPLAGPRARTPLRLHPRRDRRGDGEGDPEHRLETM